MCASRVDIHERPSKLLVLNTQPGSVQKPSSRSPTGSGLLPASPYLQVILDGAREHELPADYQVQLAGHSNSRVIDRFSIQLEELAVFFYPCRSRGRVRGLRLKPLS